MAWLAWVAKPLLFLVAWAVFLGAERRLGSIVIIIGKRLSFYNQLVWISANLYIQVVVVLWPRLKFGLQQTFEIDDNRHVLHRATDRHGLAYNKPATPAIAGPACD